MKKKIVVCLCLGLLYACSPKISTKLSSGTSHKSLDKDAKLYVYLVDEAMPKELEKIGSVSVESSTFTSQCDYQTMLGKAKEKARPLGANVLKMTEYKPPASSGSACHQFKIDLYKGKESILKIDKESKKSTLKNVDYALLHVYRFSSAVLTYDLKLGDSVLCRVQNDFKTTLKIKKEGLNSLIAQTETTTALPFDVVFGKEYYLRCSVKAGVLVGRPKMELVSYEEGKMEFDSFKAKRNIIEKEE